jgi:hypothetical protein
MSGPDPGSPDPVPALVPAPAPHPADPQAAIAHPAPPLVAAPAPAPDPRRAAVRRRPAADALARVMSRLVAEIGEHASGLRRALAAHGAADPGVQLAAIPLRGALQRLDRVAVLLTVGAHCEG